MKVTELKIGDKVKCYRYFTGEVVGLNKYNTENVEVKIDDVVGIDDEDDTPTTTTCRADELELIKTDDL